MLRDMEMSPREQRIWELHNEGKSISQIAEALEMSKSAVKVVITSKWAYDKERL